MTTHVHTLVVLLSIVAVHIGSHCGAHAFPSAFPQSTSSIIPQPSVPYLSSRRASSSAMAMASSPRRDVAANLLGRTVDASVPPPPPLSMPVWSFSCMVPFHMTGRSSSVGGGGGGGGADRHPPSSSMSIVTYATPVSTSSPRLWAISLYKTSLTRCAFLGMPNQNDEYNDMPSISSSITTTAGYAPGVRRRADMGEAGILGGGGSSFVEGSAGWRSANRFGGGGGTSSGGGGVGVLQLLSTDQSRLVPILGKTTGWDVGKIDKRAECAATGCEWATTVAGSEGSHLDVLPGCALYMQMKLKRVTDGGDHDVAICEVIGTGIWDDAEKVVRWLSDDDVGNSRPAFDITSALYSGQLRDEGVI